MGVKIRPYVKRGKKGWEVDIVLVMPDSSVIRERRKSPFSNKAGTQLWADQRMKALLIGQIAPPKTEAPTFGEFFPRYVEGQVVANREKPSSIDSKNRVWKNYLRPRFADTRLDELKAEDVQALKGQLSKLRPKTVNNALSLLNGMLKTAQEWGVIRELPVRIKMLKNKGGEVSFYEPAEFDRLVAAASKIDPRAEATVLLGGDAGLRTGEMIGLRWSDIDFTKGEIQVRRSVWQGQTTLPKSGKGRSVPMTKRLSSCLKSLRHLVREEVLYREGNEATTRSCLNKWLMRAERKAGLVADGALHRLRHTFCSRLAREGAPAAAISKLAGHSSFSTTARYIHLFEGEKENAIRLLDRSTAGDMLETETQKASGDES